MARKRQPVTTFADLVTAHGRLDSGGAEALKAYKAVLAAFSNDHGAVDDVFWGSDNASGAAVTIQWRPYREARLHRVSDQATSKAPEIAGAIQDWSVLAVRAQSLRGQSAQVCMRWILGAISYLIATVLADPNHQPSEKTTKEILERQKPALKKATDFYIVNAVRGAHIDYFWGMVFGAIMNAGIAFLFIVIVHWLAPHLWGEHVSGHDQAFAIGAVTAGAIGTILSVLLRMTTGRFGIAYEVGRTRLFVIGSFRPFIGAAFGAATFFALQAGFISVKDKSFPVIVFVAFLAGFSERFARDTILGIGKTIAPAAPPHTQAGTGVLTGEADAAEQQQDET